MKIRFPLWMRAADKETEFYWIREYWKWYGWRHMLPRLFRIYVLRRGSEPAKKDFPLGITDYGRFERSNIGYWKDKEQRFAQEDWGESIRDRESIRKADRDNEASR